MFMKVLKEKGTSNNKPHTDLKTVSLLADLLLTNREHCNNYVV